MNQLVLIGLVVFLFSQAVSRHFYERALQALDNTSRTALHQMFLRERVILLVAIIIFIGLFFINHYYAWVDQKLAYGIYVLAAVIFLTANLWITWRKIKAQNYSPDFIKNYMFASIIKSAGLIIFFILLALAPKVA